MAALCFILYFSKRGIPQFSHVAQNHSFTGGRAWPSKARECQQQGGVHTQDNGLFKPQRAAQCHIVCMGCSLLHTHKRSHSYRPLTVTSLLPKPPGLIQVTNLAPHPTEGRKQNQTPGLKRKAKHPASAGWGASPKRAPGVVITLGLRLRSLVCHDLAQHLCQQTSAVFREARCTVARW